MSFPFYNQLSMMDCGPACLRIIASYYGKLYPMQFLRDKCHITKTGVSLLCISNAAEDLGFRTASVKPTWIQLRTIVPLPCIVRWHQRHFVVVYKIKKQYGSWSVYVSDPAQGRLKYSEKDFLKGWLTGTIEVDEAQELHLEHAAAICQKNTSLAVDELASYGNNKIITRDAGSALLLEPTPNFYAKNDDNIKPLKFSFLLHYLKPYKIYLVQLILAMLTASVISLILPFLTQAVVDTGIGTRNISFIIIMLIAQVVLTLGQMANNLIRSWLMLHMTTRISISLISDFLAKLMRLPIAFFDSKLVGDIMQRISDYDRIRTFLTSSLLSTVMALVSFIIYGAIMGGYDLTILGVFCLGSVIYIGWILLFMNRRRKLDYMRFQEAAANQSSIVQLIYGMQDIKLNNCEKQKRWEWESIQAKLFNISVKGLILGQTQEVGGTFIDQTKNVFISFLAASAVIEGNMTLGMMVALQYIIGQLNAPLSQFIQFMQATQDAKISLERLSEIQEKQDEEPANEDYIREIPHNANIEFQNVSFQYDGPHSEKALDDITVCIPSNKITAIVGASGSGKTTMLKMMLGFYPPSGGSITINGRKISLYSASCWRKTCGTVMQEGFIFSDTIANNISLADSSPTLYKIRQAAEIANIDSFIDTLPLGYNTKIGADGHGLSTGQRQRLLIARAAYKDANYLFFDEATNSLDANNERMIMERLDRLFKDKTVVIVAHRLSTVKNADNIIVLDHGRLVEQGTHQELTAKRGYYYELVKNQLELGS